MSPLSQLNSIFQEVFDDPGLALKPETGPEEIPDWDSVAQVKLVLAVEDAFGMRFTTEEVASLHCVGDFIHALNKRQGNGA
jgi:acyl carrier protein